MGEMNGEGEKRAKKGKWEKGTKQKEKQAQR